MTIGDVWTFLVPWPREGRAPAADRLEADRATRRNVARHLGLEGVSCLTANFEIRPWMDGVEITGSLNARVSRLCGLTLEGLEEVIDETFLLRALRTGSVNLPASPSSELIIDLDSEEPPEAFGPEGVELGAFLVETLALALDPFPRKIGAVFEVPLQARESSPFDVLAARNPSNGMKA